MLNNHQLDQLITIEQWLEQIQDSPEFKSLDIHPDLNLSDARQAIAEVLDAQKPSNFTPTEWEGYKSDEDKPVMHLRTDRPWHEKLKQSIFEGLREASCVTLIIAALSGTASIFCWGVSDIKAGMGDRTVPDFAAQSQMYRGAAIASVGVALGCAVVGGCISGGEKDV